MSLAQDISNALGGQKAGDGYVVKCCCHEDNEPSLSVKDITNKDGEPDVVLECHAGCGWKEIKDELRTRGLLPEFKPKHTIQNTQKKTPESRHTRHTTTQQPNPEQQTTKQTKAINSTEKPSYSWKMATKDNPGIAKVINYFKGRGINFDSAALPPALRYGSYKDKIKGDKVEMVVCAATKPDDKKVFAVQRLFLKEDSTGNIKKDGAKMIGAVKEKGRGVWFYRKRIAEESLVVGEGVETTLSAMQATGINGVACLTSGNMPSLQLPIYTLKTVYILVDQDKAKNTTKSKKGYAGQRAALKAAEEYEKLGVVNVFLVTPSDGCFVDDVVDKLDFNDLKEGEIKDRFNKCNLVRLSDVSWRPPVNDDDDSGDDDILTMMLNRFVYMRNGNKIVDLNKPPQHALMKKEEFITAFATLGFVKNGEGKPQKATTAFFKNKKRKAVVGERYHPGKEKIYNAEEVNWFNSFFTPNWPVTDKEDKINIIKEHLSYLFPGDDQLIRFTNWLAWTVCKPEIRIKFTPLLISSHQGTGRGFLDEMIKKIVGIWNTSSVNMPTLAGQSNDGQYHNYLYESVFCSMPEVRVDSADAFKVDDAIRSKLTENYLPMNLKYGTNGTYPCFANFLMASNHKNALVLEKTDRRIDVFEHFESPRSEKYYDHLYATLDDNNTMSQVKSYLCRICEHNIDFNPNGRAIMSNAKRRMISGGQSTISELFDYIIENESRDVLTFLDIKELMIKKLVETEIITESEAIEQIEKKSGNILGYIKSKLTTYDKKIRVAGKVSRVFIIRNEQKWVNANPSDLSEEVSSVVPF